MPDTEPRRSTGKVLRIRGDYGFVTSDEFPGQELSFKLSWFRGATALAEGDVVTFHVKTYGENIQAHFWARPGEAQDANARPGAPFGGHLLDWAYLGYLPNVLNELKALALSERWGFSRVAPDPAKPLPILWSYLSYTFARLVLERKVMVNEQATFAAFNTGLVDSRFEPIPASSRFTLCSCPTTTRERLGSSQGSVYQARAPMVRTWFVISHLFQRLLTTSSSRSTCFTTPGAGNLS